jgi:uncharacterized protein (DUF952 family)
MPIFHLVPEQEWRAAQERGVYEPASLAAEGFVHFSYRDQVARTANRRFADARDLIVVEIDPARLGHPVVDEDLYGADEEFPHVYASIPTSAAVAEHPLQRTVAGTFEF